MTFKDATARYVHRFTMDHAPAWAMQPMPNGLYPAPQYRSDKEWFENTLFPPHAFSLDKRDTSCHSTNQTWPLGKTLSEPFSYMMKGLI